MLEIENGGPCGRFGMLVKYVFLATFKIYLDYLRHFLRADSS